MTGMDDGRRVYEAVLVLTARADTRDEAVTLMVEVLQQYEAEESHFALDADGEGDPLNEKIIYGDVPLASLEFWIDTNDGERPETLGIFRSVVGWVWESA